MERPNNKEYPLYFQRYTSLVPEGDIIDTLCDLQKETISILHQLSEEVGAYRYEPDKWSIKEVLGHVIDTERVFQYRALCFARDTSVHQPGFDQDAFAENANYHGRSILDISEEYRTVRDASVVLFRSFDDQTAKNIGRASDYNMSLQAIPFIIAGHELHHRKIIEDKYVKKKLIK